MSNYVEDYQMSSIEEKLDTLRMLYNSPSTNLEQKTIIKQECYKLYSQLKGRAFKEHIMNLIKEQ